MKQLRLAALLTLLLAVMAGSVLAQQTTPPAATDATPPPAADTPPPEKKMSLWDWFVVGGWCMWPLLGCSIAGVGLVIRNEIVLQKKKLLRPDVIESVTQSLLSLDVAGARQQCQANSTLITRILDVGLERAEIHGSLDVGVMEKAMEEASTEQMSQYLVPINFVNTVAVIAPMLGLLGTVSGMIKAFFTIGIGGMGKPELLANNIGEALITTEAGLIIAIPAMGYYFYCKNKFIATVAAAGTSLGKVMDVLRITAAGGTLGQSSTPPAPEA